MFKIGLKLWSINRQYIQEAKDLYHRGLFDYIELFSVPNSYDEYIDEWKRIEIPFIIHAPHFHQGMNLSLANNFFENMKLAFEALKFADELKAPWVIFHPGVNGSIEETSRQLNLIGDRRILIENKPALGLNNESCVGSTPQEISYLKENSNVGFCLDIGHALCAANFLGKEKKTFLSEMIALKPEMFHMTDGDWNGVLDSHDHFGKGNYNFDIIGEILPAQAVITIECIHDFENSLGDFEEDTRFVKRLSSNRIKKSLVLKQASWRDVNHLFDLANDKDVRNNAFFIDQISLRTHLNWFSNQVNNQSCLFFSIFDEDVFLGTVRFDFCNEEQDVASAKISISIRRKYRGLGLGVIILDRAMKELDSYKLKKIRANIFDHNHASKKIFFAAGFKPVKQEFYNGRSFWHYSKDLELS